MISNKEFRELCKPPISDKAYYHPFLCDGNWDEARTFLIGINPATPITKDDISFDEYINSFYNGTFYDIYNNNRKNSCKTKQSRTRLGINSFVNFLNDVTKKPVIETNVIPYPTANIEDLYKEPDEVINRGKEIFLELLQAFKPQLLIFHGKTALEAAIDLLKQNGIVIEGNIDLEESIQEMELHPPLAKLIYFSSSEANIMACRHLMRYGKSGKSFEVFKKSISSLYKKDGTIITHGNI